MKRTPINRSTYLRRGKGLIRTRWQRRVQPARLEAAREFRELILQRDGSKCRRCRWKPVRLRLLHVHHILPRSRGGKDAPENVATLCSDCHRRVHDHTAADWREWVA